MRTPRASLFAAAVASLACACTTAADDRDAATDASTDAATSALECAKLGHPPYLSTADGTSGATPNAAAQSGCFWNGATFANGKLDDAIGTSCPGITVPASCAHVSCCTHMGLTGSNYDAGDPNLPVLQMNACADVVRPGAQSPACTIKAEPAHATNSWFVRTLATGDGSQCANPAASASGDIVSWHCHDGTETLLGGVDGGKGMRECHVLTIPPGTTSTLPVVVYTLYVDCSM
jgi:hypothetical protein